METIEQFLARGGKIEQVQEAPRVEKCSQPFGAAAPAVFGHNLPDLRTSTFSKGAGRERGR